MGIIGTKLLAIKDEEKQSCNIDVTDDIFEKLNKSLFEKIMILKRHDVNPEEIWFSTELHRRVLKRISVGIRPSFEQLCFNDINIYKHEGLDDYENPGNLRAYIVLGDIREIKDYPWNWNGRIELKT